MHRRGVYIPLCEMCDRLDYWSHLMCSCKYLFLTCIRVNIDTKDCNWQLYIADGGLSGVDAYSHDRRNPSPLRSFKHQKMCRHFPFTSDPTDGIFIRLPREPRRYILIRGQRGFTLLYGSEGRGGCVTCLWQAVYSFNSLTDKPKSERRPPMTTDISLLYA